MICRIVSNSKWWCNKSP